MMTIIEGTCEHEAHEAREAHEGFFVKKPFVCFVTFVSFV